MNFRHNLNNPFKKEQVASTPEAKKVDLKQVRTVMRTTETHTEQEQSLTLRSNKIKKVKVGKALAAVRQQASKGVKIDLPVVADLDGERLTGVLKQKSRLPQVSPENVSDTKELSTEDLVYLILVVILILLILALLLKILGQLWGILVLALLIYLVGVLLGLW